MSKNVKSQLGLIFLLYPHCNDSKFTRWVQNDCFSVVVTYFVRKLHFDGCRINFLIQLVICLTLASMFTHMALVDHTAYGLSGWRFSVVFGAHS